MIDHGDGFLSHTCTVRRCDEMEPQGHENTHIYVLKKLYEMHTHKSTINSSIEMCNEGELSKTPSDLQHTFGLLEKSRSFLQRRFCSFW